MGHCRASTSKPATATSRAPVFQTLRAAAARFAPVCSGELTHSYAQKARDPGLEQGLQAEPV